MSKRSSNLKNNLERLMKQRNLSTSKICRDLSMNKSTFHNYLNGVYPQGVQSLLKISDYFDITLEELMGEEAAKIMHRHRVTDDIVVAILHIEKKKGTS